LRLGEHFSLAEFTRSETATRERIHNIPSDEDIVRMKYLVSKLLDPLRGTIAEPIYILSGYRSANLNAAVKGSSTSQHMRGEAADIRVDGFDAKSLAIFILSADLPFDQMIWYSPERGGHIHIALSEPKGGEVLYAPPGGGYINQNTLLPK